MSLLKGGRGDLRDWIGDHLDPLETYAQSEAGPIVSDFDGYKDTVPPDVGIRVNSAAEFDNAGLLRKSGGAGTTNINLDTSSGTFNNCPA